MLKALPCFGFVVILLLGAGCGGGSSRAPESRGAGGEADTNATLAAADTYRSPHDPDAFYTRDNMEFRGSYLKVDMDDLTPDQFNRVVHRLMTEKSTCGSGLTIDECLVNRPWCRTAVELLKQVVREEKLRG